MVWFLFYPSLRTIREQPTKRYCLAHLDSTAILKREKAGCYRVEKNRYDAYIIKDYPLLRTKLAEYDLTLADCEIEHYAIRKPD